MGLKALDSGQVTVREYRAAGNEGAGAVVRSLHRGGGLDPARGSRNACLRQAGAAPGAAVEQCFETGNSARADSIDGAMRHLSAIVFAAVTLSFAAPAAARTTHDEGGWLNLTVQGPVDGGRLVYFMEVQPRVADGGGRFDMLLVRPAIGWKASARVTLYQGFAYVLANPAKGDQWREQRSFQQLGWNAGRVGPGDLSTRTRLEQRWRSDGTDTGWRVRQMARYRLPLRADRRGIALLGSAEAFVALNDTDWGARAGFDQLRSFVGLELPVGGASTAEVGYLNHLVDRGDGWRHATHVAAISIFFRH